MRYAKKRVIVEAIPFAEVLALQPTTDPAAGTWHVTYSGHTLAYDGEKFLIPTLEGTMALRPGDMLITGIKGELYPCRHDIFVETYEPLECSR